MRSPALHFSEEQSFSCVSCGKCCGVWEVPATKAERERIQALKIPVPGAALQELFVPDRKRRNIFYVAKTGRKCVFLDEKNLCRIHSHHGEAAKPLACRIYPFDVFNWKDGSVSASLRFDCPAVAAGQGRPMSHFKSQIRSFAAELSKSGISADASYGWNLEPGLDRLRLIASAYCNFLLCEDLELPVRLLAAARLLEFHSDKENSKEILGADGSFMQDAMTLVRRSREDLKDELENAPHPDARSRIFLRYLLAGFLRTDESAAAELSVRGVKARLRRGGQIYKFITGRAKLSDFLPGHDDIPALDPLALTLKINVDKNALAPLRPYLGSKLKSLHFCGYPLQRITFEEGMRQLLLAVPSIVMLAAMLAQRSEDRAVREPDVRKAIEIIDHTFSKSPFFGLRHTRSIIRRLASRKIFPAVLKISLPAL